MQLWIRTPNPTNASTYSNNRTSIPTQLQQTSNNPVQYQTHCWSSRECWHWHWQKGHWRHWRHKFLDSSLIPDHTPTLTVLGILTCFCVGLVTAGGLIRLDRWNERFDLDIEYYISSLQLTCINNSWSHTDTKHIYRLDID